MKRLYYVSGTSVYSVQPLEAKNTFKVHTYKKETVVRTIHTSVVLVVAIVALFLISYVYLMSSITSSRKNINQLQQELYDVKAENVAMENRIVANSPTIVDVKKEAKILNMSEATSDQIIYYDTSNTDYMVSFIE